MQNKALNIFIVEDSDFMSNAIVKHLTKEFDYKVNIVQFDNVQDAIRYNKLLPDVMLLDHILQDSNGVDSIPSILNKFDDLRIAVISGQNDMDVFTSAYSFGAVDYIRKDALFFHQVSDFVESQLCL